MGTTFRWDSDFRPKPCGFGLEELALSPGVPEQIDTATDFFDSAPTISCHTLRPSSFYESQYKKWTARDLCYFPWADVSNSNPFYEHENDIGKKPNRPTCFVGMAVYFYSSLKSASKPAITLEAKPRRRQKLRSIYPHACQVIPWDSRPLPARCSRTPFRSSHLKERDRDRPNYQLTARLFRNS